MGQEKVEKIIEAVLFASDQPVPLAKLKEILGDVDTESIKASVEGLKKYYESGERGVEIVEIAGGYRLATKTEYSVWINRLYKKSREKLRGASLETLAIVVYKQPITKAEIEAIRGVNVDGVVKTLLEKNLIKIKGRKDSPGRPLLFGSTDEFLVRFGLKDLKSLPPLKEFTEKDLDFAAEDETMETKEQPSDKGVDYGSEETKA